MTGGLRCVRGEYLLDAVPVDSALAAWGFDALEEALVDVAADGVSGDAEQVRSFAGEYVIGQCSPYFAGVLFRLRRMGSGNRLRPRMGALVVKLTWMW